MTTTKGTVMLHFKVNANKEIIEVTSEFPQGHKQWASSSDDGSGWMTRHDFKSMEDADKIAKSATEATGKVYLPVDSGYGVSPRFDVIEAPTVGDDVSYAFNGDYYPCGQIKSISDSYRVIVAIRAFLTRIANNEDFDSSISIGCICRMVRRNVRIRSDGHQLV